MLHTTQLSFAPMCLSSAGVTSSPRSHTSSSTCTAIVLYGMWHMFSWYLVAVRTACAECLGVARLVTRIALGSSYTPWVPLIARSFAMSIVYILASISYSPTITICLFGVFITTLVALNSTVLIPFRVMTATDTIATPISTTAILPRTLFVMTHATISSMLSSLPNMTLSVISASAILYPCASRATIIATGIVLISAPESTIWGVSPSPILFTCACCVPVRIICRL